VQVCALWKVSKQVCPPGHNSMQTGKILECKDKKCCSCEAFICLVLVLSHGKRWQTLNDDVELKLNMCFETCIIINVFETFKKVRSTIAHIIFIIILKLSNEKIFSSRALRIGYISFNLG